MYGARCRSAAKRSAEPMIVDARKRPSATANKWLTAIAIGRIGTTDEDD
jgi:hypothetical protein